MDYDRARERVYGMTYAEWKEKYQTEASTEQNRLFEESKPLHADISGHNK
jgi:hypothetical protein